MEFGIVKCDAAIFQTKLKYMWQVLEKYYAVIPLITVSLVEPSSQ